MYYSKYKLVLFTCICCFAMSSCCQLRWSEYSFKLNKSNARQQANLNLGFYNNPCDDYQYFGLTNFRYLFIGSILFYSPQNENLKLFNQLLTYQVALPIYVTGGYHILCGYACKTINGDVLILLSLNRFYTRVLHIQNLSVTVGNNQLSFVLPQLMCGFDMDNNKIGNIDILSKPVITKQRIYSSKLAFNEIKLLRRDLNHKKISKTIYDEYIKKLANYLAAPSSSSE